MRPIRHPTRHSRDLAIVLAVALAACAAPVTTRWEKAGAAPEQVKQDSEDCRVQVRLAPRELTVPAPSPSTTAKVLSREEERAVQDGQAFQKCMRDKGYTATR
jgi:hypothetical protein